MVGAAKLTLVPAVWLSLAGAAAPARAQPVRIDLTAVRRTADLDLQEVAGSARMLAGVPVREVTFDSLVWSERGQVHPARIRAFVAVPAAAGLPHSKPAVILAHGLGAQADAD